MGLGETQVFQDERSRSVICPHGAGPGSHLRVRAPNTGQEMTVIVPAGVGPGGQFVVPLPAAPPPRGPFYPYMAPGHGG